MAQDPARAVRLALTAALASLLFLVGRASADTLEMLNGATFEGKVLKETATEITFEAILGKARSSLTVAKAQVHAVTTGARRRVLNEKPAEPSAPDASMHTVTTVPAGADRPGRPRRGTGPSVREIQATIDDAGRTPPDWWDSVPLSYPPTLNLEWEKVSSEWDAQRNLGQYLFSVVDANESKFRAGARLFHHTLTINKDDKSKLHRSMTSLGHIYCDLLEDYARAAFWLQQADRMGGLNMVQRTQLAQCYWKLGSKQMAMAEIGKLRRYPITVIKLLAEMGELERAVRLALGVARSANAVDIGYLAAADAYRLNGHYKEAEVYYKKVLGMSRGSKRLQHNQKRSGINLKAMKAFEALDVSAVPDGTYPGSSIGYSGNIEVSVTVKDGRIEALQVTDHRETRALGATVAIPRRITEKQRFNVDAVTGATVTSDAIVSAAATALADATN